MSALPEVVTHNYDPRRGPFRNLCSAGAAGAQAVLDEIAASGRRAIKPSYLRRRWETEAWLLAERTAKLGAPKLAHPIYFFLGDFADGADPSRPCSIILPLSIFGRSMVTFTYPDSMASLPLGRRADLAAERRPYHGTVFTLDEIRQVVATHGLPERAPPTGTGRPLDRFIEMQLWDERPLRYALRRAADASCAGPRSASLLQRSMEHAIER